MTFYTKTEVRALIHKDLKKDTLNRWLKKIEEWTLYSFNEEVPTSSNYYVNGQPVKRKVYDETDIKHLQELYYLRVDKRLPLAYAIHKVFLTDEDFEKWKLGKWDREAEWQKLIEKE